MIEISRAPEESLFVLDLFLEWSGVQQNAPVECRAAVLVGKFLADTIHASLNSQSYHVLPGSCPRLSHCPLPVLSPNYFRAWKWVSIQQDSVSQGKSSYGLKWMQDTRAA